MKSEPSVYSIDDLKRDGSTSWEGVRNYQARNFMRDSMKKGDLILFYHSNAEPSGVAGVACVKKEGYPEKTVPWVLVDVEFVEKFKRFVSLEELKLKRELAGMMVTRRGARLSVQPVDTAHFQAILKMGRTK